MNDRFSSRPVNPFVAHSNEEAARGDALDDPDAASFPAARR